MWRVDPLRVITPLSPPPFHTHLNSPLFPHRHYLSKADLDVLEQAEDYLSGRKKQELTSWWLQYIEDHVDKFLLQKGYDSTCVPYQYLDKPPTSMTRLQENIKIVRSLLTELGSNKNPQIPSSSSTYISRVRLELVDPIKKVVYEKVDALCNNLKLVLWDIINGHGCRMDFQHITDLRNYAFVEEAYLLLNTIRESISPSEAAGINITTFIHFYFYFIAVAVFKVYLVSFIYIYIICILFVIYLYFICIYL